MTASVVGSICLRVAGVRLLGCTHAASILLTFGLLASDCRVLYERESCRKTLVIVLGQIFVVVPLCHSSDCGCSEVHILLSLQGFPPEFTLVVKMFWVKSPIVIEILTKLHTVHDSTHTHARIWLHLLGSNQQPTSACRPRATCGPAQDLSSSRHASQQYIAAVLLQKNHSFPASLSEHGPVVHTHTGVIGITSQSLLSIAMPKHSAFVTGLQLKAPPSVVLHVHRGCSCYGQF